jgi:nucleoside-diphosphate-sugar epimerase
MSIIMEGRDESETRFFLHGIQNFTDMKNQVYNVGLDDANLSKIELCEKIKRHIPDFVYLEAPIGEDPDRRDYIVSNDKILNTGYLPRYSLEDGKTEFKRRLLSCATLYIPMSELSGHLDKRVPEFSRS